MLAVRLSKRTGAFELAVDTVFEPGITGVFGPSGAGKSTLLDLIAGIETADSGRVVIGDRVIYDSEARISVAAEKRGFGCVFQSARLFPHLSVRQNLVYGRRMRERNPSLSTDAGAAPVSLERVVELLDLGDLLGRRVRGLSGGEAQRVAIGRALLAYPRLLLLDEPLSALDTGRRRAILTYLSRIGGELDLPMLFVSHSLSEIQELTSRVLVLDEGRVLAHGELAEVLADRRTFELASRLGLETVLEVEIVEHTGDLTRAAIGSQTIVAPKVDLAVGSRGFLAVRPHDVMLALETPTGVSARNALAGEVIALARLSDRWLVTVDVGRPLRAEITEASVRELDLRPGAKVRVLVKTYSLRWA